jgi:EmrB/QacA subfamily drug resistance transporter
MSSSPLLLQEQGVQPPLTFQEGEPRQFSRRTIALTLLGTMLVSFIATLDQTIVGTALPRIIATFSGFALITWVTTVYLLTSTVTIPIAGKLSDLLGRKRLFLVSLLIFLIGSLLAGAAQSMMQLVLFRALQGVGAGGLQPIGAAIIADLFPPRERGRWMGITSSSAVLATLVGPLLGGLLTDTFSWRWVFYVNLPLGLITLLLLVWVMPRLDTPGQRVVIDYTGSALIVLATLLLLLGFTFAGGAFAWLSWQSLGLFGGAIILLVLLVLYSVRQERLGREPIVEPSMFKQVRIFSVSVLASMLISIVLFGSVYFLGMFLQGVVGVSATTSGLTFMPLALTSIVGAVLAGQLITATGRYKGIALAGAALLIAGLLLLLRLDSHSTYLDAVLALVVLGPGLGASLSLYTVAAQNAMPDRIGQATSAVAFFRQLGQAIGLAAIGAVATHSYVPAFQKALPASLGQDMPRPLITVFEDPSVLLSPSTLSRVHAGFEHFGGAGHAAYNAVLDAVRVGLTQSTHDAILLSLGLMLFTFLVVCFLKEIPMRSREEMVDVQAAGRLFAPERAPVANGEHEEWTAP